MGGVIAEGRKLESTRPREHRKVKVATKDEKKEEENMFSARTVDRTAIRAPPLVDWPSASFCHNERQSNLRRARYLNSCHPTKF